MITFALVVSLLASLTVGNYRNSKKIELLEKEKQERRVANEETK